MAEKRITGHFDDARLQVDKTGDPGFFVRFLDASKVRSLAVIASLVAPGEACGGVVSDTILQEARQRGTTMGATNLRFESMDVQSLPFPDQRFDRVLASQLLVHVPNPSATDGV